MRFFFYLALGIQLRFVLLFEAPPKLLGLARSACNVFLRLPFRFFLRAAFGFVLRLALGIQLPPQILGLAARLLEPFALALRGLARESRGFLLRHALGFLARLAFCVQLGPQLGFHPRLFLARLTGALQGFPLALGGGLPFPLYRLCSRLRFPFRLGPRLRRRPCRGVLRRLYRRIGFGASLTGALQRFALALRSGLSFPLGCLGPRLRFRFRLRPRFRRPPRCSVLRCLYRRSGFCANPSLCIRASLCLGSRARLLYFLASTIVEELLLFRPRLRLGARLRREVGLLPRGRGLRPRGRRAARSGAARRGRGEIELLRRILGRRSRSGLCSSRPRRNGRRGGHRRGLRAGGHDLAHEPILVELENERLELRCVDLVELDLQVGKGRLAVDLRQNRTVRPRQKAGLPGGFLYAFAGLRIDRGGIHGAWSAEFPIISSVLHSARPG